MSTFGLDLSAIERNDPVTWPYPFVTRTHTRRARDPTPRDLAAALAKRCCEGAREWDLVPMAAAEAFLENLTEELVKAAGRVRGCRGGALKWSCTGQLRRLYSGRRRAGSARWRHCRRGVAGSHRIYIDISSGHCMEQGVVGWWPCPSRQ